VPDLSPFTTIQAIVQYGAVACLVFIVLAYQTGKIMSGQVHRDAIVALQKAKADSETLWKERYDEVRNDRDRYRDIALMNSQLAARGTDLASRVLEERVARRPA
jgi:hypothetical protein